MIISSMITSTNEPAVSSSINRRSRSSTRGATIALRSTFGGMILRTYGSSTPNAAKLTFFPKEAVKPIFLGSHAANAPDLSAARESHRNDFEEIRPETAKNGGIQNKSAGSKHLTITSPMIALKNEPADSA